jgi:Mg-chelatase subunit ChlD
VQEDPPELRIAGRCKTIERHGRETYPPAGSEKRQAAKASGRDGRRRSTSRRRGAGFEIADSVDAPNTHALFVYGRERIKLEYVEHTASFALDEEHMRQRRIG